MALAYELTFADVPFLLDIARVVRADLVHSPIEEENQLPLRAQQPFADLIDELDRIIPFKYFQSFLRPPDYPGRNLGAIAYPWSSPDYPSPQVRIGDWYYPNTASRWSVFRGLATSEMVKEMLRVTQGSSSATFKMKCVPTGPGVGADTLYTLSTSMYMLPPRPLAEHGGQYDGLFLITLVDERWYWQTDQISLKPTKDSTWASLVSSIATDLNVTISNASVPAVYGTPEPDSQLWTNAESTAVLLDAIGFNIGRTVCRKLDGTYILRALADSQLTAIINRGGVLTRVRSAGGDIFASGVAGKLKAGDLTQSRNSVIPASIDVAFPKYVQGNDPVPHFLNSRYANQRPSAWYEESFGDMLIQNVPLLSGGGLLSGMASGAVVGGTARNSGLVGVGTHVIHTTAKALVSGESTATTVNNASGLRAMAMQLATDYWGAQVGIALDEVYPGTYTWEPEGFHDIIWTWSARSRQGSTRVIHSPWNQFVREFQHSAPALTNQTNVPRGIGGPSVAQSWRDSYGTISGANSFTLAAEMTVGDVQATLNDCSLLPTQNRWRGIIASGQATEETVLFEACSGGGTTVDIAWRGIDGSVAQAHANGIGVNWVLENQTYGNNLLRLGAGFFLHQGVWTSGGVSESVILCPSRSILVLDGSGKTLNTLLLQSGQVLDFNPNSQSGSQFVAQEFCWVMDRNGQILRSGIRYDGQLVGYSLSGTIAPFYVTNDQTNQSGVIGSGTIGSGVVQWFNMASGAIRSGHVGNQAVVSGSYSSGSVGQMHLSSGAVSSGHLANSSVTSGSYSSGSIGRMHISSGAVNSGHIGDNAVTSGNVASGSISSPHIDQLSIQNYHILSGAISSGYFHIANNVIISGNIASGEIGGAHIGAFEIQTLNYALDSVNNAVLQGLSVTSDKLASGSVISGKIASGQVGNFHISSGSVTSGRVGMAGTPDGSLFFRDDFTWAAVGAAGISSGSIGSGKIASGSVQGFFGTTRHIVSGTVGQMDFGSGAVVSGHVGSGAVAGAAGGGFRCIASGTVGANDHASGCVVSGHIGSGAVQGQRGGGARNIASGTLGPLDLSSGNVLSGHIDMAGTPTTTTFFRGDFSWAAAGTETGDVAAFRHALLGGI